MKERNYHILRAALDRLPSYRPDGKVSDAIFSKLDAPISLGERLPSYAPPASIWNGVSEGLDRAPRERASQLRMLRPYLAVAAGLLLLLSVFFFSDRGPSVSYAYSQEPAPAAEVVADWDDENENFSRVREEVDRLDRPHLNTLGYELDELNSAREEVKAMLVAYGEDPDIVNQLAEIERERDDVYRRIIVEL